jgi:hypothetical protein
MRLFTISLSTLLISFTLSTAQADGRVIWDCRTSNPDANPILHLVEWGEQSYVKFSYMRFAAHFQSDNGQRAWYWHNDGSGYYRYGLVLGDDGKAWYHRFGGAGESEPLDHFICGTAE